ncbi:MAG: VOC family protein [Chloroflexi bacterium]|nr:VOC family protein [Chloroflexota bacterium]
MLKKMTPNLMVEDVNRTIEFYRDVLGFELLVTVPEEGQFDWAMMRRDDVEIMFQARSSLGGEVPALANVPIGGSLTFYTEVTGLMELYERLKGQVEIVQDLHTTFYGTQEFAFGDCNGYILGFSEAVSQS